MNGNQIFKETELLHNDRIVLGHGNGFQVIIPKHTDKTNNSGELQFGAVMNDRLQSDTPEAKNIRRYLKELEERIGAARVKRFVILFAQMLDWIDEANMYSKFRYEKDPKPQNDVYFNLEIITDILDYEEDEPEFAVRMRKKSDNSVIYLWDFEKFKEKVEMMADWYEGMKEGAPDAEGDHPTDPWIDAPSPEEEAEQRATIISMLQDRIDRIDRLLTKDKAKFDKDQIQIFEKQKERLKKLLKDVTKEAEINDNLDDVGDEDDLDRRIEFLRRHNKQFGDELQKVLDRINAIKENANSQGTQKNSSSCVIF